MELTIIGFGVTRGSIAGLDRVRDFHFVPLASDCPAASLALVLASLSTPYIAIATPDVECTADRLSRQLSLMRSGKKITGFACGKTVSLGSVMATREYAINTPEGWFLPSLWPNNVHKIAPTIISFDMLTAPPKLSLLICHLNSRVASMIRLMEALKPQMTPAVEVLIESDDGQTPVSSKRNTLLQRAGGEYVAFIDDDDMVPGDYVKKVLAAFELHPDCCGLMGLTARTGLKPKAFARSLRYKQWRDMDGVHYASPCRFNPVRRELALKAGFDASDCGGNDKSYALRLLPHLKSEVFISGIMYHYTSGDVTNVEEFHAKGAEIIKSAGIPQASAQGSVKIGQDDSGDTAWKRHKERLTMQDTIRKEAVANEEQTRGLVTETMRRAVEEYQSLKTIKRWMDHAVTTWPKEFLLALLEASKDRGERALIQSRCDPKVFQPILTMCVHNHSKMLEYERDVQQIIQKARQ